MDTKALASNGLTATCTDTGQGRETQAFTSIGAGNRPSTALYIGTCQMFPP